MQWGSTMKAPISAVLIGSELGAQNGIQEVFRSHGDTLRLLATANDLQQGMQLLEAGSPQIAILDIQEIEQGVREAAHLVSRFPHTALFVTAAQKNPDWILRLIRAGAQEYLTKPVEATELVEAVRKIARLQTQLAAVAGKRGGVVSVYTPLGGMGTTTIAVNLAAALAARGKETALIDLNPCSGDVAAFLDLAPRYTLSSVVAKAGELDANFLRSVIVGHASAIHVLCGPDEPWEAARLQPELLQELIGVSRALYEHTIIDAGGPLNHGNLAAFESSDQILFNTVLSLPALRNARRHLAALEGAGLGGRLKLVINRHFPKDEITLADTEKILGIKTFQTVPNAFADVKASINQGVPLVTGHPKSPAARALEELADKVLTEASSLGRHPF